MDCSVGRRTRRVHGAEIKAKVLAECQRPGASLSAVALSHGLNANLVRSWMRGRGLQRAGLKAEDEPGSIAVTALPRPAQGETGLQFVPVRVAGPSKVLDAAATPLRAEVSAMATGGAAIEVELCCGSGRVTVRWPAVQATECAAWLRELAPAILK